MFLSNRKFIKYCQFFMILMILKVSLISYFYSVDNEQIKNLKTKYYDTANVGKREYPLIKSYDRKDWHDYTFIEYESTREGNGEKGQPFRFTNQKEIEEADKMSWQEGLNVMVSDQISVERSLPDPRPQECKYQKYLIDLPQTSVIVIFYNEWPSILKRTIHSIFNRTPHELLKELILVDDNSTNPELKAPFELYLKENFDERVKLVRLTERKGLIVTRIEGANVATGDVLVFLDSHIEVNVNWLPPLLEPIVISPTTVTTPQIDFLVQDTFEYSPQGGVRGVFDELMWYKWFSLRSYDTEFPEKPHQIPIMLGCAFAIRRDYYDHIGRNDEQLMIWNGEQIELSLKLHMCGGDLVEVPCSRICHTFRKISRNHVKDGVDFTSRNFMRVGEVWLDKYKEVMYTADPEKRKIDLGDLTKMKLIREKLNCKPFKYFLEQICPEMYYRFFYAGDFPGHFAEGLISLDSSPELCIDTLGTDKMTVQLFKCRDVTAKESFNQYFTLTWHRRIRHRNTDSCIQDNLYCHWCRYDKDSGFQDWKYDYETKQLTNANVKGKCLTGNGTNKTITLEFCEANNLDQQWTFTTINKKALDNYDQIYYRNNRFYGMDLIFENNKS